MAAGEQAGKGALDGIRVVDLTRYLSGPLCTQNLGDMGAEVIKVEPLTGDPARYNAPVVQDRSGYFPLLNRNKKSLALNMATQEGREVMRRLVLWGDVLVENFRPGVMARLGFDNEHIKSINPRMIVVAVSGFGQTGPYSQRAGFDFVVQAMVGGMSLTGDPDGPPVLAGGVLMDTIGGLYATIGALAALQGRQRTNEGQVVDASLYEGGLITVANSIATFARGMTPQRGVLTVAPAGTFRSSDGIYIFISAHDDGHFPLVASLVGRPEMANDPEYKTKAARGRHVEELNRLLGEWASAHTIGEIEATLNEGGVPFGRVQSIEDVVNCPHLEDRQSIVKVDHGAEKGLPMLAPHPRLSGTPSAIYSIAPHLGEHTDQVCHEILGFSKDEIAQMREIKVVK